MPGWLPARSSPIARAAGLASTTIAFTASPGRGLDGLPAGSRAVVHIPAALGYGTEGRPGAGIPADSALVYEVKLLEVRP